MKAKWFYTFCLAAILGVGAGILLLVSYLALPDKAEAEVTADDVMRGYGKMVWSKLGPKLEEMDQAVLIREAAQLATQHVLPHKSLLVAEGRRKVKELPKFDFGDRSQWELVWGEDFGTVWPDIIRDSELREDPEVLRLVRLWDPLQAAKFWREAILTRAPDPNRAYKRLAVEGWVGAAPAVADRDSEVPVIAFPLGNEVFLIQLRLKEEGYYLVGNLRWLRNPNKTPKVPVPSKEPTSAKELMDRYQAALRNALVPALDQLSLNALHEKREGVMREYLFPHRELMAEAGRARLAELPGFDLGDRSAWEPVAPPETLLAEIAVEGVVATSAPSRGDVLDEMYGFIRVNPVAVAVMDYQRLLFKKLSVDAYHNVIFLAKLAPSGSRCGAVDPDPDRPIIAVPYGDDVILIALERSEEGSYVEKRIEWLRRKDK